MDKDKSTSALQSLKWLEYTECLDLHSHSSRPQGLKLKLQNLLWATSGLLHPSATQKERLAPNLFALRSLAAALISVHSSPGHDVPIVPFFCWTNIRGFPRSYNKGTVYVFWVFPWYEYAPYWAGMSVIIRLVRWLLIMKWNIYLQEEKDSTMLPRVISFSCIKITKWYFWTFIFAIQPDCL